MIETNDKEDHGYFAFSREEANLLMLYLQEHLRYEVSEELKIGWLCGCGRYHPKDYVCERIGK